MAPHDVDGWCVGPSEERCRCHKCCIPSTRGIRDALTVDWFPHKVPFPKVSTDNCLRQTAADMLTLIQDKVANPGPLLTHGSSVANACIQIAQILKQATALPVPPQPAPTPLSLPVMAPPVPEQRVLTPASPTPQAPASPTLLTAAPEQRVLVPASATKTKPAAATKPAPATCCSSRHLPNRPSHRSIRQRPTQVQGPLAQVTSFPCLNNGRARACH